MKEAKQKNTWVIFTGLAGLLVAASLFFTKSETPKVESLQVEEQQVEKPKALTYKELSKKIEEIQKKSLHKVKKEKSKKQVERKNIPADSVAQEISQLIECKKSDNCPVKYDENDPMGYSLAMRQKQIQLLQELGRRAKVQRHLQNYASTVARKLITEVDIFVQLAALDLLKQLPKSKENREALMAGVHGTLSPKFMEESLEFLSEYNSAEEQRSVENFVINQLNAATFMTQLEVANYARKHMRRSNVHKFYEALDKMHPGSRAFLELKRSLKDFELSENS